MRDEISLLRQQLAQAQSLGGVMAVEDGVGQLADENATLPFACPSCGHDFECPAKDVLRKAWEAAGAGAGPRTGEQRSSAARPPAEVPGRVPRGVAQPPSPLRAPPGGRTLAAAAAPAGAEGTNGACGGGTAARAPLTRRAVAGDQPPPGGAHKLKQSVIDSVSAVRRIYRIEQALRQRAEEAEAGLQHAQVDSAALQRENVALHEHTQMLETLVFDGMEEAGA